MCGETAPRSLCITKFAVLSAVATSKHLFTLPLQLALIPHAAPQYSQYLSFGGARAADSAPDVRGKSFSHCGGRGRGVGVKMPAGQRSKSMKKRSSRTVN